jgi:hypothetical protein
MVTLGVTLIFVGFAVIVLGAILEARNGVRGATLVGFLVCMVLAFLGVGGVYLGRKNAKISITKSAEAVNPPARVECADGVRDCTLTVVVPERNHMGCSCRQGNYSTQLRGFRQYGGGGTYGAGLHVTFNCPVNEYIVYDDPFMVWTYGPNDLALADGRPVDLMAVNRVQSHPAGRPDEIFGPFDVYDKAYPALSGN